MHLGEESIDVTTYFDMVVVQLRSICVESPTRKNNYTVQNLLNRLKRNGDAQIIENMLNESLIDAAESLTIRTAIKILADGFIYHYDSFEGEKADQWMWQAIIERHLRNPFYEKV